MTERKYLRRRIAVVVVLLLVAGLGVAGYANRGRLHSIYDQVLGRDYAGPGTGSVTLVINSGESGLAVASDLQKLGVVKNADIFYRLIVSENVVFYPGSYQLKLQMSSQGAIDAIRDPNSLIVTRVTIKEGLRIGTVLKQLATATGKPLSDFTSAASDLAALGVPASEPSAEGYLFPATYSFDPGLSAKDILKQMVDRTFQELDHYGVATADRHKVLTLASIIQKEARQTPDFYKVSRVFQNRIAIGMPLQSDATVSYGSGGTTVTTTDAERADPNGYNTYVHKGLPIGPIGGAGSLAIDAALHPATGSWLYFCAINLKTGETVFSTTIAEHEAAVKKFQAWIQANPGWNGN
ncbi:MAG: endolytic transglycosylase MltG [Micrococcales bacterium]